MNFDKNFSDFLYLSLLDINSNLFSKTKFNNKEEEIKFQNYISTKLNKNKYNLSNIIKIFFFISILLFIILAFYRNLSIGIFLVLFFFYLIITGIKSVNTNKNHLSCLSHIQNGIISIFYFSNIFLICFLYNNAEKDNFEEIIRMIFYYQIFSNILIFIKFEANIYINFVYFLTNFISVIFAIFFSLKNHFYFLDAINSVFIYFIFYIMRKDWDLKLRILFSDKVKFEFLFNKILDYLKIINVNFTIINNYKIFNNDKIIKDKLNFDLSNNNNYDKVLFYTKSENFIFEDINQIKKLIKRNIFKKDSEEKTGKIQKNDEDLCLEPEIGIFFKLIVIRFLIKFNFII